MMVRERREGVFILALVFFALCLLVVARPAFAINGPVITGASAGSAGGTETVTADVSAVGGTPPYSFTLLASASSGGTYAATGGSCSQTGNTATCSYTPAAGTFYYEVMVTDNTMATATSTAYGPVTVSRASSSIAVSCSPTIIAVSASTTCTATVGGYMPSGTITFSNSGTASLTYPTMCSLNSVTQDTSSCSITVSATGGGNAVITAAYGGDTNNAPPAASGTTSLSVSRASSITIVACAPSTVIAGEQVTCTATINGYSPTGTVTWSDNGAGGVFSANPCTLSSASCGVSYTAAASATITATYAGDTNNLGSSGSFLVTVNIQEMIQITVANSGPQTDLTLSGCSISPSTVEANGAATSFTATSGCSGIVATLPSAGANTRYLTAGGKDSLTLPSCSSSSCALFSATIYYQVLNTYQVSPASPSSWSMAGPIPVTGTALGSADQQVCMIAVTTGTGEFSCQGWSDYGTQVALGALQVNQDQRWATGESTFTDTSGGNVHTSKYFSQVLETFEYSLIGSTTAPSAPSLSYTDFGGNSTLPLTGSQSLVWMDTGSSWSVPITIPGSTSSERWQGTVTSGAATAGQTVALSYYHQFLINFGFSVVGGGTAYVAPSVQFTSFGSPEQGTQGWVDAASTFTFTNPLAGSTASERWFTPIASGVASTAGTVSPVYYHQYAFAMNFTVSGGGTYDNPRLNFTALGKPGLDQVNTTTSTTWADSGTRWNLSDLLPNSSPTERWITSQATTGTALAPVVDDVLYYHQYLGTLRYSISGSGGAPPVPSLNYTTLKVATLAPLNETAKTFWMDSGSLWSVPVTLPGVQGERWLSNVTLPTVAGGPFEADVQFQHQFYVEVGVSTHAGGQVANSDQWEDQGATVTLNATAAHLWTFAYWKGVTTFSYNGTTRLPAFGVSGPTNETAVFFPGLFISTNKQGSISYSYGTISGTVPAGSNTTIYPPPGRNVTLTALPKSIDIMFNGWTGVLTDSHLQSSVAITAPGAAQASFSTDYTDIRTFAIATIGIIVAACYIFIARRGFTPKLKQ